MKTKLRLRLLRPLNLSKRSLVVFLVPIIAFGAYLIIHTFAGSVFRPFTIQSEWNNPLPTSAPLSSNSAQVIAEIEAFCNGQNQCYPHFPSEGDPVWGGTPVYTGKATDILYTVTDTCGSDNVQVHIPDNATMADNTDGEVVFFDSPLHKVVRLWQAVKVDHPYPEPDEWSSCGQANYDTKSNGLEEDVIPGGTAGNFGWRGVPPGIKTLQYNEVSAAVNSNSYVRHVIEVVLMNTVDADGSLAHNCDNTSHSSGYGFYWPMSGGETDDAHTGINTCEGLMLRLKLSDSDLVARGLTGGCLAIAKTLHHYGGMIGDTGSVPFHIGLENLVLEGRAERWADIGVTYNCMQNKVFFSDFEAIQGGYDRPPAGG